ncbi:glycosyltransferase [Bacillus alkalicellulosilyticus]|uniref:glycosyltransferase n=1 Tax=Alkalihalobacterium alkalicellulosilyticum TaxID=1912214 RepID=UPI00099785AF|nr:glycosyltransferase [Bacillus alkalicellulosilyticus]
MKEEVTHHVEVIVNESWKQACDKIEISIVMPSYNKYPLNLISLLSIENQTYDFTKFEVLLIDDASTDETNKKLTTYQTPFPFKYVRLNSNLGRAKARNLGITMAKGKLIIFLDAEMIVEPNFIEQHVSEHKNNNKAVVTGACHLKNVYTTIYPQFTKKQFASIKRLSTNIPTLKRRYMNYVSLKKSLQGRPGVLYTKEDIRKKRFTLMSVDHHYFANEIVEQYGEEFNGFYFPWMAFLTGNVSFRKDFIKEVGMFDEEFVLYGYEDWELGYRLYKAGAIFKAKKELATYHQEHPISENKWNEAVINYDRFTKKHPDFDVYVQGLEIARIVNLHEMNKVAKEYNDLTKNHPHQFESFKKGLWRILETTAMLLRFDIGHKFLFEATGIDSLERRNIKKDLQAMKRLKKYRHLVRLFEKKIQ